MLQAPTLLLSLVLASIYATAFHLWLGRRLRDLFFFWLAAIVGFASGQIAGYLLDIIPWTVGQVHVVEATLVSVLFLVLARWLMQVRSDKGQGSSNK
jgi:uncharacterized membrane protein YfcA